MARSGFGSVEIICHAPRSGVGKVEFLQSGIGSDQITCHVARSGFGSVEFECCSTRISKARNEFGAVCRRNAEDHARELLATEGDPPAKVGGAYRTGVEDTRPYSAGKGNGLAAAFPRRDTLSAYASGGAHETLKGRDDAGDIHHLPAAASRSARRERYGVTTPRTLPDLSLPLLTLAPSARLASVKSFVP